MQKTCEPLVRALQAVEARPPVDRAWLLVTVDELVKDVGARQTQQHRERVEQTLRSAILPRQDFWYR